MSLLSRDWRTLQKRYTRKLEQWTRKWDPLVPDSFSGNITSVLLPVLGGFLTLFLLWGVLRTAHIRTVYAAAHTSSELKQLPASLDGAKEETDGSRKFELVHLDDDAETLASDKAEEVAGSRAFDELPSEHGGGKSEAGRKKKKKAGRDKERRKGKNALPAAEAGNDFGSGGEALEEPGERASRSRERKASNPPRKRRKKRKPQNDPEEVSAEDSITVADTDASQDGEYV